VLIFAVALPGGVLCWITLSLIRAERERLAGDVKRSFITLFEREVERLERWWEGSAAQFGEEQLSNYRRLRRDAPFVRAFIVSRNGKIIFPTSRVPFAEHPTLAVGVDYEELYPLFEAELEGDVRRMEVLEGMVDANARSIVRFARARKDGSYRSALRPNDGSLEGVLDGVSACYYLKVHSLLKEGVTEAVGAPLLALAKRLVEATEKLTYSEVRFYYSFINRVIKETEGALGRLLLEEVGDCVERVGHLLKWRREIEAVVKGKDVGEDSVVFEKDGRRYHIFYERDGYLRECVWGRLSRSFSGPVCVALVDSDGKVLLGEEGSVRLVESELPVDGVSAVLYYREAGVVGVEAASKTGLLVVVSVLVLVVVVSGATILYTALLRRMRESERKSDFLTNISHELKTPLTAIRMNSETLVAGRYKSEREMRRMLDVITHQTERLQEMIDRLLRFSRMERGIISYSFREVRLSDFIDSVVYEFKLRHRDEDVRLHLSAPDAVVDVEMDADAMKEALLNILDNGVKYTPNEPKKLFLRVSVDEERLSFEVEDEGVGIPKWAEKKVFEQFFRVPSGERKTEGAGIGLAIAKRVVEAHRGKISLKSEEGKGTVFRIVLPLRR